MLSPALEELVQTVARRYGRQEAPKGEAASLHSIVSTAASFYEKVRYLVDYREEHTIRRSAIERILKRKLFIEGDRDIGFELIRELANGTYVAESYVTENVGAELDAIINAYVQLIGKAGVNSDERKMIASFAASEIDRFLSPERYFLDDAVVRAFYRRVRDRIEMPAKTSPSDLPARPEGFRAMESEALDMQVHAAIRRSLLHSDDDMIAYSIFATLAPQWRKGSDADQSALAGKMGAYLAKIREAIKNPLQHEISRALRNDTVNFLIIRDLVSRFGAESEAVISDPEKLEKFARGFLARKYELENAAVKSGGIRAVIYLLITKMILALVIELPYELYVLGGIAFAPLLTNIVFHPLVLFAATRRVPKLGAENSNIVIANLSLAVYGLDAKPIKLSNGTLAGGLNSFFAIAYGIFGLLIFGFIVWLLHRLGFNPVSIGLFIFFLALVSFFAYRIRANARRWKVSKDTGTLSLFGRLITLPIISFGRWLSGKFSSVNIFVFILDFIIETPFKVILGFSDSFLTYLQKKVDETY